MVGNLKQYSEIVKQLANTLKYEQLRCGYVSDQTTKLLKIREDWLVAQKSENSINSKPGFYNFPHEFILST